MQVQTVCQNISVKLFSSSFKILHLWPKSNLLLRVLVQGIPLVWVVIRCLLYVPSPGFERIHNMTAEAFAFTTESSEELHKPFEFCSFKIIKSWVTYVIKLHYPGKKSCSVTADASFKLLVEGQIFLNKRFFCLLPNDISYNCMFFPP